MLGAHASRDAQCILSPWAVTHRCRTSQPQRHVCILQKNPFLQSRWRPGDVLEHRKELEVLSPVYPKPKTSSPEWALGIWHFSGSSLWAHWIKCPRHTFSHRKAQRFAIFDTILCKAPLRLSCWSHSCVKLQKHPTLLCVDGSVNREMLVNN